MTVREFLITLEEELKYLPKNKKQTILNIYLNKINNEIDYGTPEEKIIKALDDPKTIAKEIYENEGIDYLERRKRKLKSDDLFRMLISSITCIFTLSAVIFLTYLLGNSCVKYVGLLSLIDKKEIIWMSLLIIGLIGTEIILYLYIIDIFILIFNFLLDRIIKPFGKENKLTDFSIIDFIESKLKVNKIFKKLLIGFVVVLVFGVISNIVMQTYLFRTYTQKDPVRFEEIVNVEDFNNYTDLKLDIDEAKIYIKNGDTFNINVKSEFEKNLNVLKENGKITIEIDDVKKYDIFNFLKEPLPIMEITIPKNYNLSIVLTNGLVDIQNIIIDDLYLNIYQGNIYLINNQIVNGTVKTSNCGLGFKDSNFENLKLESINGQVVFENTNVDTLDINNFNADITTTKMNSSMINLVSSQGNIVFKEIQCNNIEFNTTRGQIEVNTIECLNKIRLVSSSNADITLANANAKNSEVISISGDVIYYNVNADSNVESAATILLNKIKGAFTINCLGNFLTIQEAEFSTANIQTKQTETSIKFIKADKFEYVGMNSKSTLYFVFAKNLIADDPAGDILIDNYKNILTDINGLELYDKYYQKVETFTLPTYVAYRDSEGIQY